MVAIDRRLVMLNEVLRRTAPPPPGRVVVMAARITPTFGVGPREFPALDTGARVPAGRVLPIIGSTGALDVLTWNTGEASDLRQYGNITHAERQFVEFMRGRDFTSIEIELSHSPCTACADTLAGWLKTVRAQGATVSRAPSRRVEGRILIGSPVVEELDRQAALRWGQLYATPPQATNWACLGGLQAAGWSLAAPGTALPIGTGAARVRLL